MRQVAQVGCGYWGPNLLRNLVSIPDCRVKWVVETAPDRAHYVTANFKESKVTDNLEDVLSDPAVSAVVVATPAATHKEIVLKALNAGKHVLVEKPLALNVPDAEEILLAAKKNGLVLMAGHTFLFNAAVGYLAEVLKWDQLGKLFYIYAQRLNLGRVRADVNAWWNLAPHDVSILLHLLGGEEPEKVNAVGMEYIQPGVEDVVFATLTWPNKVIANIQVSWLDPNKVRRMTFVGSQKMAEFDDVADNKITIFDHGVDKIRLGGEMDFDDKTFFQLKHRKGDVVSPFIEMKEPLRAELEHFLDCIENGKTPLTDAKHALSVVRVMSAVEKSYKNGGVTVELADHR